MKFKITTAIGDFSVFMSYSPSPDDMILNRFTDVINKASMPHQFRVLGHHPELSIEKDFEEISKIVLDSIDEGELEKALYNTTCIANGAGQRVVLSLKNREIHVDRW